VRSVGWLRLLPAAALVSTLLSSLLPGVPGRPRGPRGTLSRYRGQTGGSRAGSKRACSNAGSAAGLQIRRNGKPRAEPYRNGKPRAEPYRNGKPRAEPCRNGEPRAEPCRNGEPGPEQCKDGEPCSAVPDTDARSLDPTEVRLSGATEWVRGCIPYRDGRAHRDGPDSLLVRTPPEPGQLPIRSLQPAQHEPPANQHGWPNDIWRLARGVLRPTEHEPVAPELQPPHRPWKALFWRFWWGKSRSGEPRPLGRSRDALPLRGGEVTLPWVSVYKPLGCLCVVVIESQSSLPLRSR